MATGDQSADSAQTQGTPMTPMSFGTALRQARKLVWLTVKELSEKSGVTANTIGNLEQDRTKPRYGTKAALMGVLGPLLREHPDRARAAAALQNIQDAYRAAHQLPADDEPAVATRRGMPSPSDISIAAVTRVVAHSVTIGEIHNWQAQTVVIGHDNHSQRSHTVKFTQARQRASRSAHPGRARFLFTLAAFVATFAATLLFSAGRAFGTPTPPIAQLMSYTFKSGTESWHLDEQKPTVLRTTIQAGRPALQVTAPLWGNQSPSYLTHRNDSHPEAYPATEAAVYFTDQSPESAPSPDPYFDLRLKTVSCDVWLPSALTDQGVYVRLLAKDRDFHNDFGKSIFATRARTEQWVHVSLVIDQDAEDRDAAFDSAQVGAIGVRLDTTDQSAVEYTGPFYISNCAIQS